MYIFQTTNGNPFGNDFHTSASGTGNDSGER